MTGYYGMGANYTCSLPIQHKALIYKKFRTTTFGLLRIRGKIQHKIMINGLPQKRELDSHHCRH